MRRSASKSLLSRLLSIYYLYYGDSLWVSSRDIIALPCTFGREILRKWSIANYKLAESLSVFLVLLVWYEYEIICSLNHMTYVVVLRCYVLFHDQIVFDCG